MKMCSPTAVKAILPALFDGLLDSNWQVKEGTCKCLGWLADTQQGSVGACLVDIIPKVSECLGDTKKQVASAARKACGKACLVIDNPDILPIVPDVIKTIGDVGKTEATMDKLLATTFVTQIDQPTLAIMVPILSRSLADRRALMKRKGALVIDNMCKLVAEPMDMAPFAPVLEPKLTRNADEIASEEIREFTAKALATLRLAMGDAADTFIPEPAMTVQGMVDVMTEVVGDKAATAAPLILHSATMVHFKLASDKRIEDGVCDMAVKPYLEALMGAEEGAAASVAFNEKCDEIISAAAKEQGYVMQDDDLCHIDFSLAYGGKVLLQNTRMHLKKGRRYGLIGGNGVGKTTLMRAIDNNQLEEFPNDLLRTIFVESHSSQEEDEEEMTVMDFILKNDIIREEKTVEQIKEALFRMGFTEDRINQTVVSLSGGWLMKLALSRAMLYEPQIMMLDEPTNHMDVKKVAELVNYLNGLEEVTCLIVSHDTKFLDNVCTDILHYETRKLVNYHGNLSAFVAQKPEAKSYFELASSQGLVWNFPDPGFLEGIKTTTKAIAKMQNIVFAYPGTTTNLEGETVPNPIILNDVTTQCCLASRVACIGPNGAGKSTLVKCLVGDHEPQSGEVWKHPHLRMAYVSQHAFAHVENHLEVSPVDYIQWRYSGGVDKEQEQKDTLQLTPEEEKRITVKDPELAKAGINQIGGIMGRRKRHNEFEYECYHVGQPKDSAYFIPLNELENMVEMGWHGAEMAKMIQAMDEKLAQQNSIVAQRQLTTGGIQEHLDAFGLEAEFGTYGKIVGLSGGQKVKVVMGSAMWNCPHLLVLDEPTNYLDRESLGAMAAAIKIYKGGILLITHNSEFSQTVCPETWLCPGNGKLEISGADWMIAAEKARAAAEKKAKLLEGFDADKEDVLDAFGNKVVKAEPAGGEKKKLSRKEKLALKKKKKNGGGDDEGDW